MLTAMTQTPHTPDDPRLPHPVREIAPAWIPMPDGTRLAGRIWLPAWASAERPVPALLELIPYRTRDLTALRDETIHAAFAANGYASARIDIRGSGDSEGLIPGEYLAQELADGAAIIAWLAAQPWCTGRVGMFGNSWGGFNALQVAALRPPALGAIVTSCSTDDRFTDDMHHRGGALLTDGFDWGATFLCWMALPPDPAVSGPGWRERWLERIALAADAPAAADWLRHQERDAFWRHGSVIEDHGAIVAPTLALGGWQDGYSNAIPRLLTGLSAPVKGIIGPWAHGYPHTAGPGPGIDFLGIALAWWDRWLRDVENGADAWPALQAFLPDGLPPEPWYATAEGRWVAETTWPSPRIRPEAWGLGADGTLVPAGAAAAGAAETIVAVRTAQDVGSSAGEWCPFGTGGRGPELPGDQADDDARSVCFDGPVLTEPLEILGAPELRLALPADARPGLVIARLCDVAPDGRSTRVSYVVRHAGAPGDPGIADGVLTLTLDDVAYAFLPGHRVRVALATTSWPMVWPEAVPGTLRFHPAASALVLPVRPSADAPEPIDLGRAWRPAPAAETLVPGRDTREVQVADGRSSVRNVIDSGRTRLASNGIVVHAGADDRSEIADDDPGTARFSAERTVVLEHPGGPVIEVRGQLALRATPETWFLTGRLLAMEDGAVVADRPIDVVVPRRIP